MEIIAPILGSAGVVALVQLFIKFVENTQTFKQWKTQREATVADELYSELKKQNERLIMQYDRLLEDRDRREVLLREEISRKDLEIDAWQDRYYKLLVEKGGEATRLVEPPR